MPVTLLHHQSCVSAMTALGIYTYVEHWGEVKRGIVEELGSWSASEMAPARFPFMVCFCFCFCFWSKLSLLTFVLSTDSKEKTLFLLQMRRRLALLSPFMNGTWSLARYDNGSYYLCSIDVFFFFFFFAPWQNRLFSFFLFFFKSLAHFVLVTIALSWRW